jgi:hypothetical protein
MATIHRPRWVRVDTSPPRHGHGVEGAALVPRLVYSAETEPVPRLPFGVLGAFIRLRQAGAEEVAAFIRRYGALEVCEHGFPLVLGHGPMPCGERWCIPLVEVGAGEEEPSGLWEPLEAWHRLSRHAYAVLVAAACVQEGRPFPQELLPWLAGALPPAPPYRPLPADWQGWRPLWARSLAGLEDSLLVATIREAAPLSAQLRMLVWEGVALWTYLGHLTPTLVSGRSGSLEAGLYYYGLAGLIALELLAAVTTRRGVHLCDGCGDPFTVPEWKRRPRWDRRRYCLPCQFGTDDPEELERAREEGRRSPSLAAKREWARRHRARSRPSEG